MLVFIVVGEGQAEKKNKTKHFKEFAGRKDFVPFRQPSSVKSKDRSVRFLVLEREGSFLFSFLFFNAPGQDENYV